MGSTYSPVNCGNSRPHEIRKLGVDVVAIMNKDKIGMPVFPANPGKGCDKCRILLNASDTGILND